jgi:hypothetical protein
VFVISLLLPTLFPAPTVQERIPVRSKGWKRWHRRFTGPAVALVVMQPSVLDISTWYHDPLQLP